MFGRSIAEIALYGNRVVLGVLVIASFVNLGLYLAKLDYFRRHLCRSPRQLLKDVEACKDRAELQRVLSSHPTIETRLIEQGLASKATSAEDFQRIVNGLAATEQVYWERFTAVFAWTSATGPMAGLLGTILGLMKAFSDLAVSDSLEPRVALSGIADALLTTVLGIVLAIPATAYYNHCKSRTRRARATVESLVLLLAARNELRREPPSKAD